MRRAKVPRKEKPKQARWVPVRADDCRVPKYLVNGVAAGFERALAENLAMRAHPDQCEYAVVEVGVFRWARAKGEPISAARAVTCYVPDDDGGEQ